MEQLENTSHVAQTTQTTNQRNYIKLWKYLSRCAIPKAEGSFLRNRQLNKPFTNPYYCKLVVCLLQLQLPHLGEQIHITVESEEKVSVYWCKIYLITGTCYLITLTPIAETINYRPCCSTTSCYPHAQVAWPTLGTASTVHLMASLFTHTITVAHLWYIKRSCSTAWCDK